MRSIKVSDQSYKSLKEQAKEQGCFISSIVDRAVAIYLLQLLQRAIKAKVPGKRAARAGKGA
jgi:hypothetical protein